MFELPNNGPLTRARLRLNAIFSSLGRGIAGLDQHQLIVCGFPRSGTSLIYNMLSSSLEGFRCEPFEQYYMYRIHRLGNYATKAPMDVLHIPWIEQLNINKKNITVLVLVRDVRDIITSRHPVVPDKYFIGHDQSWWPQDKDFRDWRYNAPGVIKIFDAIQAIRDRPDTTIIRYEDLVTDPDAVQEELVSRHKFSFTANFSGYHEHPEKHAYKYEGRRAPVDATLVREGLKSTNERIDRWRNRQEDIDRIVQQFSECESLFHVLEAFDYENDRDWFEHLA